MKGSDLKSLRTRLGLSQAEVARICGYFSAGEPNRSQISRYENNYQKINGRLKDAIIANFSWEAEKRLPDPDEMKNDLKSFKL